MKTEIQKIQFENCSEALRTLVLKCAASVANRENREGIDTFILSESLDIRKYPIQNRYFDTIFATIAEQFIYDFGSYDFDLLPFWRGDEVSFAFLAMLWKDYFSCEIDSMIDTYPAFAIKVIEMVVKDEDTAWSNAHLLGLWFRSRYL